MTRDADSFAALGVAKAQIKANETAANADASHRHSYDKELKSDLTTSVFATALIAGAISIIFAYIEQNSLFFLIAPIPTILASIWFWKRKRSIEFTRAAQLKKISEERKENENARN